MRVFYANSFTIAHGKDYVCVALEFQIEGKGDSLCVVLSPSGAKTLAQALAKHIDEIEAEHGNVEAWKEVNSQSSQSRRDKHYIG